ncbi:MAG TPA: hypothetical protein VKY85_18410 [Candidatus Angelobacter sp.]|nr:hypothetical protein [Candidatus Angelobacter sp.]
MTACLILFLLLVPPNTQSRQGQNPAGQSQQHEAVSSQQNLGLSHSVYAPDHQAQQEKTTQGEYDPYSDRLYRWYLRATVIGVFVGFIGISALIWQNTITRKAANAAKESADAVVNSERAWVMADLHWGAGEGTGHIRHITKGSGENQTGVHLMLVCTNQGRTPGWIDEIKARIEIVTRPSPTPDIDSMEVIRNEPAPLGVNGRLQPDPDFSLICAGWDEADKMILVSGVVKYRDAFGGDRKTFFGYVINPDCELQRIAGFPEYNKNT